jgi:hypothetical protein
MAKAIKLPLHTSRMLDLLDFVVEEQLTYRDNNGRVKQCLRREDALIAIGYIHVGNIANIKAGRQSFQPEHFAGARKAFGTDTNYFFDEKCTEMISLEKYPDPYYKMKAAMKAMELHLREQKAVNKAG